MDEMHKDVTTGARSDAIELLSTDHREVSRYFHLLEVGGTGEVAHHAAEEIVRMLSVHAAVEEQMLYPVVRQCVPGGDALADRSLEEHGEMKRLLDSVDGHPVDDPDVRSTFRHLSMLVQRHVAEEEGVIFPRLRDGVGEERLMKMGDAMVAAEKLAPTHPHPHAPDRPPMNVIAGVAAAVIDKVRDAARRAMD